MPGKYTALEDMFIIKHRLDMTQREMAKALGRSRASVRKHCSNLIRRGWVSRLSPSAHGSSQNFGRLWTHDEESYLLSYWGLQADALVATHLDRSIAACKKRAYELGINKYQNWYRDSFQEVEAA